MRLDAADTKVALRDGRRAGVLTAIGNTPLVRLERLLPEARFELYAKLEALNPGGSIKDRPAHHIIEDAIHTGLVRPGTVVIESSSGNFAIGLAQACAYHDLRLICVIDPRTTPQNVAILRTYGAEIDLVEQWDPRPGEYLATRLARVAELIARHPDSFWPNQYANLLNPLAHRQTMQEIVSALPVPVDYLFCATSTCGTLRACCEYIREQGLLTRVVAVDAVGSAIFAEPSGTRLIPGHGASVRPELFRADLASHVVHVTDYDCVAGCRSLVRREAILAGGSSGAAVTAVHRMRHRIPDGAACVVILPDSGQRYLDTIYSDAWVRRHFGVVPDTMSEC